MGPMSYHFATVGPIGMILAPIGAVSVLMLVALLKPRRGPLEGSDLHTHPGLGFLQAKTRRARLFGLTAATVAASAVAVSGPDSWADNPQTSVAGVLFGMILVGAVIVGDRAAHADARSGTAAPGARQLREIVPRGLTRCVGALAGTLVLLIVVAWVVPDPHLADLESCALTPCESGWPAHERLAWSLVGLTTVVLLVWAGLRTVLGRPRGGEPAIVRIDGVLRYREGEALIAAAGMSVGVLTLTVADPMSWALLTVSSISEHYLRAAVGGLACLAVAIVAVIISAWSAVSLFIPGPPAPRAEAAVPAEARA